LLQDWANVSADDKHSTRTFLFQYVFSSNKKIESVVEKQALQTIAIMCKRGWFEGGQQAQIVLSDSLFNPIASILEDTSQDDSATKRKLVALHLMAALVDEFSYTKSNYIGLSWEYHCLVKVELIALDTIISASILFSKLNYARFSF
jgi:hypothetical protein